MALICSQMYSSSLKNCIKNLQGPKKQAMFAEAYTTHPYS